jgi:hypothetical protein
MLMEHIELEPFSNVKHRTRPGRQIDFWLWNAGRWHYPMSGMLQIASSFQFVDLARTVTRESGWKSRGGGSLSPSNSLTGGRCCCPAESAHGVSDAAHPS